MIKIIYDRKWHQLFSQSNGMRNTATFTRARDKRKSAMRALEVAVGTVEEGDHRGLDDAINEVEEALGMAWDHAEECHEAWSRTDDALDVSNEMLSDLLTLSKAFAVESDIQTLGDWCIEHLKDNYTIFRLGKFDTVQYAAVVIESDVDRVYFKLAHS